MPGYYDTIGDGIRTPGFVLAEMRTVDAGVVSLGRDIQAAADRLPDGFMGNWIRFRLEWDEFYKSNDGWLSRATNSVYEKTVEFRERLASWRDKFVQAGGVPSTPALPVARKLSLPTMIVGAGIVGAVLWYVFKVDHS